MAIHRNRQTKQCFQVAVPVSCTQHKLKITHHVSDLHFLCVSFFKIYYQYVFILPTHVKRQLKKKMKEINIAYMPQQRHLKYQNSFLRKADQMLTISDKTEEYINTITHKLNDCNNNHNQHRPCRHHFPWWGWIVCVFQNSSAKWYEVVLNHLVYQYIVSPSERESFLWESRILSLL